MVLRLKPLYCLLYKVNWLVTGGQKKKVVIIFLCANRAISSILVINCGPENFLTIQHELFHAWNQSIEYYTVTVVEVDWLVSNTDGQKYRSTTAFCVLNNIVAQRQPL